MAIDDQIALIISDLGKKIMHLFDQLCDQASKDKKTGSIGKVRDEWSAWLSRLGGKGVLGYSNIKFHKGENYSTILESIIDMDGDLFNMLSAFNCWLVGKVGKASYEQPDPDEMYSSAKEILDLHRNRQKMISRIAY